MATLTDPFTRADSSDLGTDWDTQTGEGSIGVASNQAQANSSSGGVVENWNGASLGNTQFAKVTIGTWTATDNDGNVAGVTLRNATAAQTYWGIRALKGTSAFAQIYFVNAGAFTSVTTDMTTAWATNDVLHGAILGDRIRLFYNSAARLTLTNSTIPSGPRVGIVVGVGGGGAVTGITLDNFFGGDLSTSTVRPDADGTTTGWSKVGGTGTFASSIVDDPDSNDGDTSYVLSPNLADGQMWVTLQDMPSDFDLGAGAELKAAAKKINVAVMTADTSDMYLQLERSDESTDVTEESAVCNVTVTASYTTFTRNVGVTGTQTKTNWDGARLRLRFDHTTQSTIDTTNQIRITAAEVLVYYIPTAAGGSASLTAAQGSYAYTGQTAGLLHTQNLLAAQGSYSYTGQAVGLAKGKKLAADQGSYVYSGQTVDFLYKQNLLAAQGAYAYTGQTVNLLFKHLIGLAQGSYSYTGQAVNLLRGPKVQAAQGSYSYTGQAVGLLFKRNLLLAQGSYSYTGQAVGLARGKALVAAQGAYAYTGQTAGLLWKQVIAAAQGSYSYTGQVVNLLRGKVVALVQGSYAYTGQTANLLRGKVVGAAQGSYSYTGQAANLLFKRTLQLAQGSYAYTGQAVTLTYAPVGGGGSATILASQGSYSYSGQTAELLFKQSLLAAQGTYNYSGQAAELLFKQTLAANQGSYAYIGQSADLLFKQVLAANQGGYAYTGQTAGLLRGRNIQLAQGSYAYNGQTAGFLLKRALQVAQGSYFVSGQQVGLIYSAAPPGPAVGPWTMYRDTRRR